MKLKLLLTILGIYLIGHNAYNQNILSSVSNASSLAQGGISTCQTGIYAASANPAGLAELTDIEVALFAESRFLLADLNLFSSSLAIPSKSGVFAMTAGYYGFEGFNQQMVSLSYGRKMLKKLSFGGKLDYINYRIPEYGNKGTFTFELGMFSALSKTLSLGIHVLNPTDIKINEDRLSTAFRAGLKYSPTKIFTISAEVDKELEYEERLRFGLEYHPISSIYFRGGLATAPISPSFGAAYRFNGLNIDFAANYHNLLGFTPSFGLQFHF